jgi:hypothetical protein
VHCRSTGSQNHLPDRGQHFLKGVYSMIWFVGADSKGRHSSLDFEASEIFKELD